jgi:hypothetical protein
MTWMRAAIVGKDDEKFLGDQDDSTALKASAEAPAGAKPVAALHTSSKSATPVIPSGKPAQAKPPLASATQLPAAKPPLPGTKPLVHPALLAQPVQAKPAGTVKPALENTQAPNKPAHRN